MHCKYDKDVIQCEHNGEKTEVTDKNLKQLLLHNVGNWGVQYIYHILLKNDTKKTVTFHAFVQIGSELNIATNPMVIWHKNQMKHAMATFTDSKQCWHWLQITLGAGDTYDASHTFVLGTNASIFMQHIWKISDPPKTDEK